MITQDDEEVLACADKRPHNSFFLLKNILNCSLQTPQLQIVSHISKSYQLRCPILL